MTSPIGTVDEVAALGYDNNDIGTAVVTAVTASLPLSATTGETPNLSFLASYGGTYEYNESGSAIAMASSAAFYRWITGQAGTVKGTGYVTWNNAAAPTGKRLTIGASGAGVYLVMATFSGNLTLKGDLEGVIYVNAAIQNNIRSDQKVVEDAQYTAGTVAGIVTLAAGDTVTLWFGSSVNSNTLTLKHANLTLHRIDV
jgi:hypothetical protein